MASMPLFLAIDAGGTHTRALLADSDRILARASTGTVKLQRVAEPEATALLQALLTGLAAEAGISLADVTHTCFGLAGSSSPSIRNWAHSALHNFIGGTLEVCGDIDILLDAAFPGAPGIVIIAGTGSNCIGRDASGHLHTAGGWGPVLGDEGSGFWIGLAATRAALRAQDALGVGGPSTCLLREIEAHWNLASTGDLVALGNLRASSSPPDFASLAPVVARCAADGDAIAAGILNRAGEDLADFVTLVHHKLRNRSGAPGLASETGEVTRPTPGVPSAESELTLAYTGSVLEHIPAVREAMLARLATSAPTLRFHSTPIDPLQGALHRARRP